MVQERASRVVLMWAAIAGCTPVQFERERHAALVAPHHLGEGDTGKPPVEPDGAAEQFPHAGEPLTSTDAASAGPVRGGDGEGEATAWVEAKKSSTSGFLPDPPPQASRHQWVFDVHYDRGAVRVDFVETVELKKAQATPRLVGRFALEFWIGRELLDRVRFDFPLLGGEAGDPNLRSSINLAPGVQASRRVRVAQVSRATWVQLVDRATGRSWRVPWPPEALKSSPEEPPGP